MPSVFISYRHENDAHRARVRAFAERLRHEGGPTIEVILDQFSQAEDFHHGGPPQGWPPWSLRLAADAEKIVIVGSVKWFRCYEGKEPPGNGLGAASEAVVIRQRLHDAGWANSAIRIVLFSPDDAPSIPLELRGYHRFEADRDFADLLAWLTDAPRAMGPVPPTVPGPDAAPSAARRAVPVPSQGRAKRTRAAQVIEIPLTVNFQASDTRIVLAQIRSPFSSTQGIDPEARFAYGAGRGRFEWADPHASDLARRQKVAALLRPLAIRKPNLIVFPEYSVLASSQPVFQQFAGEHGCIVIGGTVYDDQPGSPTYREDVCTIFLPNRDDTVRISKRMGFQKEEQALSEAPILPSVARLVCRDPEGKTFSINVFICRDYLVPYATVEAARVSVLDWEHPGLNVVVMCSAQVAVFKGMASLDVRRLRGHAKFVALCNCSDVPAGGGPAEGSVLLGPSRRHEGQSDDTIEEIPGDKEGMLFATLDLTNLEVRDTKPDLERRDPVKSVETLLVDSWEDFQDIRLLEVKRPRLEERGVWRPAFLEAIGYEMQIHLLVSKRNVVDLAEQLPGKLNRVTAAVLRGQHDLMIYRYCPSDASSELGPPYCMEQRAEFDEMFERGSRIIFSIRPRDFLKYRFVVIEPVDHDRWSAEVRKFRRLLQASRDEIIRQASRLARKWSTEELGAANRDILEQLFYRDREGTPPIGRAAGLRRTYVLIGVAAPPDGSTDRLRDLVILPWLVRLEEVRSAYRVTCEGPIIWDFWVDIVAEPGRTDQIVDELFRRSRDARINIAARSMDVVRWLALNSIDGVGRGNWDDTIQGFFETIDLNDIEDFQRRDISPEKVDEHFLIASECAKACLASVENSARENTRKIVRFYAGLFTGNFTDSSVVKSRQLTFARDAVQDMYGDIEERASELLVERFGGDSLRALVTYLGAQDHRLQIYRSHPVRAIVEYLAAASRREADFVIPLEFDRLKRVFEDLLRLRNSLSHANQHFTELDLFHAEHAPRAPLDVLRRLLDRVKELEWSITFIRSLPPALFQPPPPTRHFA